MNIVVIDGQGGGVGRQLVEHIKKELPHHHVMAVGTNVLAAQAMNKAGADHSATGENAVIVACRNADVIVGPIGIAIADSMWGEITPAMALAVSQSNAQRIFLPMNICSNYIVGVGKFSVSRLVEETVQKIKLLNDR